MTCEYDNLEAKAAFSDLIDTIKLMSIEMDFVQTEYDEEPSCTENKKTLILRLRNLDEVYDRLLDLSERVNVPENEPVKDDECNDDDCSCHQ
jgi:hypothetical protein